MWPTVKFKNESYDLKYDKGKMFLTEPQEGAKRPTLVKFSIET